MQGPAVQAVYERVLVCLNGSARGRRRKKTYTHTKKVRPPPYWKSFFVLLDKGPLYEPQKSIVLFCCLSPPPNVFHRTAGALLSQGRQNQGNGKGTKRPLPFLSFSCRWRGTTLEGDKERHDRSDNTPIHTGKNPPCRIPRISTDFCMFMLSAILPMNFESACLTARH